MGFDDSFGVCVIFFFFNLRYWKCKWCLKGNMLAKLHDSFLEKNANLEFPF